jgi:hypothetical protein
MVTTSASESGIFQSQNVFGASESCEMSPYNGDFEICFWTGKFAKVYKTITKKELLFSAVLDRVSRFRREQIKLTSEHKCDRS